MEEADPEEETAKKEKVKQKYQQQIDENPEIDESSNEKSIEFGNTPK